MNLYQQMPLLLGGAWNST